MKTHKKSLARSKFHNISPIFVRAVIIYIAKSTPLVFIIFSSFRKRLDN